MDEQYHFDPREFVGKHKLSLPSPSLCISLPIVKRNAGRLHESVNKSGVSLRAHLKTNKTTEITRIMLGDVSTKVAISTLREVDGLKPLIDDGTVQDVLWAIPISPSVLPRLHRLSRKVILHILVDHVDQIDALSRYQRSEASTLQPWSLFIKLDLGSNRAGVRPHSPRLPALMEAIESNAAVKLSGIYSYPARLGRTWSFDTARSILREHISTLNEVAKLQPKPSKPLVLAIGSSITARVVQSFDLDLPPNLSVEIVAGTTIYNDLQQLATGTVTSADLAMTVIAEICSVYEDRNEALINAGVLALTREPGDVPGIARVRGSKYDGWIVGRVSQEHGVLVYTGTKDHSVRDVFKIGDKIELDVQHTCIAGAMYGWHFITDEEGVVRDVYVPWKWW